AAAFICGDTRYDLKARFNRGPFKFRIHFEVAEILFLDNLFPVVASEIRARAQANFRDSSRELGCTLGALWDGASDRINDDVFRVRVFFGCGGVLHAEHVAGALDERVLEASAG